VAVAEAVAQRLQQEVNDKLPADMELTKVYDQSTFISNAVDEVVNAGLIGGLLAIFILYFFLRDVRSTLIIGLSIPVSVIATFNLMYGFDLTLNIMSLGGLALGIGLLVDNSIVVLENIARHREMGKSVLESAREGAGEVGTAVIASTLTTVAVFLPLVFVQGIAGQLFRDQALTVTFSLLASLIVALTLIPMLASLGGAQDEEDSVRTHGRASPQGDAAPQLPEPKTRVSSWLRAARLFLFTTIPTWIAWAVVRLVRGIGWVLGKIVQPFVWAFNRSYDAISDRYPGMLRWALRRKAVVLTVAFGLFIGTGLLVPTLGIELIPQLSQGEFEVTMKLPPGTPIEQSDAALTRLQQSARGVGAIATSFAVSGTGNRMDANPDEGGENYGEVHVRLTSDAGQMGEAEAMNTLRQTLDRIPGAQYKFGRPTLFTFETPIEVEISGYDLDKLKTTSQSIADRLREMDRFADVKSTMEIGHPEIQILFDRERAASLGLAVHDIADRVVTQVRGDVATRYSWRDRKIDVLVRAQEEDRASVEDLKKLIVNAESDRPVTLDAVADVRTAIGPSEIRRSGQQRVALVTANLRYGDLGTATGVINQVIDETTIPVGLGAELAGQSEEMSASFRSLLLALLLAVFLVYLVMASQFESLLHPFVIFFSIPLAGIGAVWALWMTGSTISVVVFIGLILLAGIVVNNAIVLVDLINQLRAEGMAKLEAVVEGGRLRLRPILMTTLTTTLGLLPLAIGFGEGAEIRAPMAITVIGGLIVSTGLTLVVIPVMYAVVDRRPDPSAAA
jgi:HAE1 family hydrophobic/amphiphilic exporter-1